MKGTHISKKAQRKLRSRSLLENLNMPELTRIVDEAHSLVDKHGYANAVRGFHRQMKQADKAKALLRRHAGT